MCQISGEMRYSQYVQYQIGIQMIFQNRTFKTRMTFLSSKCQTNLVFSSVKIEFNLPRSSSFASKLELHVVVKRSHISIVSIPSIIVLKHLKWWLLLKSNVNLRCRMLHRIKIGRNFPKTLLPFWSKNQKIKDLKLLQVSICNLF